MNTYAPTGLQPLVLTTMQTTGWHRAADAAVATCRPGATV